MPELDDFERELLELKGAFLDGLSDRVSAIQHALELAAQSEGLDDTWHVLKSHAHRLRGAAGCYDETELSVLAGQIEDAANDALTKNEHSVSLALREKVDNLRTLATKVIERHRLLTASIR